MLNTKFIRHRSRGFVLWDSSTEISHLEMVQRLGLQEHDILSAGFVSTCPAGLPQCVGHSGSLNLGATTADTPALRRQLGLAPLTVAPRLQPQITLDGAATP